jgi:5-oxoprolinase (ATP-hydrolysing)
MASQPSKPTNTPDPILLTLFANRFMSVAEAMGRALQQTAISTNIKERLDFSCALFAPDGDLVANAPFIPIHLGSMSLYVILVTSAGVERWSDGKINVIL